MKKVTMFAILIALIITTVSCSPKTNNNEASNSVKNSSEISFNYFFRGFITLKNNQIEAYPHDTFIIESEEDWHAFMDKYVPGIPYDLSVDYSKECLVFSSVFPARPFYSIGADIKAFKMNDNELEPEYDDSTPNGNSNGIYAQNIDDIMHCFVNIVKINKGDIPKSAKNIYHK